ncbi:hypothetical protein GC722_00505, partial [Auraticoccus sp. F435]|nr:hypothetical protein [Auraticoccus cholistanensis]
MIRASGVCARFRFHPAGAGGLARRSAMRAARVPAPLPADDRPAGPARLRPLPPRAAAALVAVLALLLGLLAPAPASAVGEPVLIDDFGGDVRGTRTVTPLDPDGTTPLGTFTESGGTGTITATGSGNRAAGVQLDYAFPSTDLRSGMSNTQFFVEFDRITRTPEVLTEPSANISVSVTDSAGGTSSYSTGIGNVGDWAVVLNFDCSGGQSACFSGTANFADITGVQLRVMYPRNFDSTGGTLTAVVDRISTTPTGAVVPSPATPVISGPDSPYLLDGPTTIELDTRFTSDGRLADVSREAGSSEGLRASDVVVGGTAPGRDAVAVSGSANNPTITIGPITGEGELTVTIPAEVLVDSWGQRTLASSTYRLVLREPAPATAVVAPVMATLGEAYSHDLAASGGFPEDYTYDVTAGALPAGLELSRDGLITGTPTSEGSHPFTVTVVNGAESFSAALTLTVGMVPVLDLPASATARGGEPFTLSGTVAGYPTPEVTPEGLPAGLTLSVDGSTLTISGTPTGAGGMSEVTVDASNDMGEDSATLMLAVHQAPAITSDAHAEVEVGEPAAVEVTTSGYPVPALTASELPDGLTLTDHGDGTATITGTATSPSAGTVTLTATSRAGTGTQLLFLLVASDVVITSPDRYDWTLGEPVEEPVVAAGFPPPTVTVTGELPAGVAVAVDGAGRTTLSGTPTETGDFEVVVTATSIRETVEQTVSIRVSDAPVFTSPDAATFTVGQAGELDVTTTGYPAPRLTVTGELPEGVSFTDAGDGTATLSGTPAAGTAGTYPLTVTADNTPAAEPRGVAVMAVGVTTQQLVLTVQQLPAFTSADEAVVTAGDGSSALVTVTGSPVPTVTAEGLPAGVTLGTQMGGIVPLQAAEGTVGGLYEVVLTATSSAGVATQELELTVQTVPQLPDAVSVSVEAGQAIEPTTIRASGFPVPAVTTYTDLTGSGLSVTDNGDGSATLTGTPTQPGTTSVGIQAVNAAGTSYTTVTVTVWSDPTVEATGNLVLPLGEFSLFRPAPVEITGDPAPDVTVEGLPPGLQAIPYVFGDLVLLGSAEEAGDFTVTVTATNATGTASDSFLLRVTEQPSFDEPSVSATFVEGSPGELVVDAHGFPPPSLTVTGELPEGVTFVDAADGTGTFAGTPAAGSAGTYELTLTATNDAEAPGTGTPPVLLAGDRVSAAEARLEAAAVEATAEQQVTLEVLAPPSITSPDTLQLVVGEPVSFTVETGGSVPAALAVESGLPEGLTFTDNGNGTATLAGTPTGTPGTSELVVTATASTGTARQTITVVLQQRPAFTSPDLLDVAAGEPFSLVVTTTGSPTASIGADDLPEGVKLVDRGDGTALLSGTLAEPGRHPLLLVATNAVGTAEQTLTVVAAEPAPGPTPGPTPTPDPTPEPTPTPDPTPEPTPTPAPSGQPDDADGAGDDDGPG